MKACCKAVRTLILCFAFFMMAGSSINVHAAEDNDTTITVNVDALRVRQNPSLKAKRLGHVNKGNTLRYIDTVDDEWIAVEFNGETAYMAAQYVTINCMGPAEEQISQEQIVVLQDAETEQVAIQTVEETVTETVDETQQAPAEEAVVAYTEEVQVTEDNGDESADGGSDEGIVLEEEAVPLAAEIVEDSYEVKLLAALIQCEAGGECYEGQLAVGAVVMNRVADPRFPETIAEVIYQPGQFTPVKHGKVDRVLESGNIYESCLEAAREAVSGASNVGTATRFRRGTRADGIVIQHHVFYSV